VFGNFLQTFGLDFPLQAADAQGGLLGFNAPVAGDPSMGTAPPPGGAGTGLSMAPPATGGPGAAQAPPGVIAAPPPAATNPGAGSSQAPPGATSPLASPLAPGAGTGFQNQTPDPAPAAGVGNQFNGKAGF
jgi:hypothetical protein